MLTRMLFTRVQRSRVQHRLHVDSIAAYVRGLSRIWEVKYETFAALTRWVVLLRRRSREQNVLTDHVGCDFIGVLRLTSLTGSQASDIYLEQNRSRQKLLNSTIKRHTFLHIQRTVMAMGCWQKSFHIQEKNNVKNKLFSLKKSVSYIVL